jgi:gamma-glutamylcyclotransferase (GGCT)/AIG2-like uncharacterized protein YtfP
MTVRRSTTGSFEAVRTAGSEEALSRLFVYGSLRTGQTARSLIANSVARSAPATTRGNIYVFPSGYPAFVEDDSAGAAVVVGELLWLDDLAATLAMLDAYEGEDFVRQIKQVTLSASGGGQTIGAGTSLWAWVYVLADPSTISLAELIPHGDWVKFWRQSLG